MIDNHDGCEWVSDSSCNWLTRVDPDKGPLNGCCCFVLAKFIFLWLFLLVLVLFSWYWLWDWLGRASQKWAVLCWVRC